MAARRLRLYDLRMSSLPADLGICRGDIHTLADFVNAAQRRLLYAKEAGDEGWWGTWAEVAFVVNRDSPYWTAPRDIARLAAANICQRPVSIHNQFVEYLQFGNGRLPKNYLTCGPTLEEIYTRNRVATFVDLSTPPQYLRVYFTDPADIEAGKRVLLQGTDNNSTPLTCQDGDIFTEGVYVVADSPYASPTNTFNTLIGIQKDVTTGQVKIYQADPTTGEEVLLVTMEPTEQVAAYRRYYFSNVPASCCYSSVTPNTSNQNITVTGIVKLELIPVTADTDYCLIQNQEAIIEEALAVRYSKMDTVTAQQMALVKHKSAIGYLNGELAHYLGIDEPAVDFAPFGSARLEYRKIGSLI